MPNSPMRQNMYRLKIVIPPGIQKAATRANVKDDGKKDSRGIAKFNKKKILK